MIKKKEKEHFIINGDIYDGEWKNNLREGKGKMIYKDKKEELKVYGKMIKEKEKE